MIPYNSSQLLINVKDPPGKPGLPATTEAPVAAAMKIKLPSSYDLNDKQALKNKQTAALKAAASTSNQFRKIQDIALNKLTNKLPYEIRDGVAGILNNALNLGENTHRQLELSKVEVLQLKTELKKRVLEEQKLNNEISTYKETVSNLQEQLSGLEDNLKSRQTFTVRNKRAIAQLASTNRMLIDSLDALQDKPFRINAGANAAASGEPQHRGHSSQSRGSSPEMVTLPNIHQSSGMDKGGTNRSSPDMTMTNFDGTYNNDVSPQRARKSKKHGKGMDTDGEGKDNMLRESLLRVAREHYKSMKLSEVLDAKVAEQRIALRNADERARTMLLELAELRSVDGRGGMMKLGSPVPGNQNNVVVVGGNSAEKEDYISSSSVKRINKIDERFKALLSRTAIEPMDGIAKIRSIVNHVSFAPGSMDINGGCVYFCNKELTQIFDVEMVCLFILQPGGEKALKYSQRSNHGELVVLQNSKSLVSEVVSVGKCARINNMNRTPAFNNAVDSVPGMVAKKVLCLPLLDKNTDIIIGTISFINKRGNDNFTEVDELYGLMYADQVAAAISACQVYDSFGSRSELLKSVLEASTSLFTAAPDPDSLAASKILTPEDVLFTMEGLMKMSLRCWKCRVFLVSDHIPNSEPGFFLLLDNVPAGCKSSAQCSHRTVTSHSGLAGYATKTKRLMETIDVQLDNYFNPYVDVDPTDLPLVTAPIVDLHGNVLAVIQLVGGPKGPPLVVDKGEIHYHENVILLGQATEWLAHQFAAPLQYMLSYIGRSAARPTSTPGPMHSPTRGTTSTGMSLTGIYEDGINEPAHEAWTTGEFTVVADKEQAKGKAAPPQADTDDAVEEMKQRLHRALEDLSHHKHSSEAVLSAEKARFLETETELHHWKSLHETAMNELENVKAQLSIARMSTVETAEEGGNSHHRKGGKGHGHGHHGHGHGHSSHHATPHHSVEAHRFDDEEVKQSELASRIADGTVITRMEHNDAIASLTALQLAEATAHRQKLEEAEKIARDREEEATAAIKTKEACEKSHSATVSKLEEEVAMLKNRPCDPEILEAEVTARTATATEKVAEVEVELQRLTNIIKDLKKGSRNSSKPASPERSFNPEQEATELKSQLAEKDKLINILRDQLVKLAGDAMRDLNDEHEANQAQTMSAETKQVKLAPPPESPAPKSARTPRTARGSRPTSATRGSKPPTALGKSTRIPTDGMTAEDMSFEGWTECTDEQGNIYYFHSESGTSSWDPPFGYPGTTQPEVVQIGDWLQQLDGEGNAYYVNQVTGESAWEIPQGGEEGGYPGSPYDDQAAPAAAVDGGTSVGSYEIEL